VQSAQLEVEKLLMFSLFIVIQTRENMRKYVYIMLLLFALMVMPQLIQEAAAQPPPPKPKDIPIDGGLAFLIVAGAVYGARKIRQKQKNQE